MRNKILLDGVWRGAYGEAIHPTSGRFDDLLALGMTEIPAKVPGSMETDLEAAGILPELFFGENVLKTQDWEHVYYAVSRTFDYQPADDSDDFLVFEGLDCIADVYIDGVCVLAARNMLIPHRFSLDGLQLEPGEHELTVFFTPACLYTRQFETTPAENAQKYGWESLYIRKAPHMYGWDIMPRIVSCGVWRHVYIESLPKLRVDDVFAYTMDANESNAALKFVYNCTVGEVNIHRCRLHFSLDCGDSHDEWTEQMWHTGSAIRRNLPNPKLWWPHNYGEPNVYTLTVQLYYEDALCDTYTAKFGIRTVKLDRTSTTDKDGNGQFCFIVNGKRIFAMGSNWVPVDAIHARDEERLPDILPMLSDLGCNIIRCWGGNVYENDLLYDYCDAHGIMIWQDFAMACGIYPQDPDRRGIALSLREEAIAVVKRLRNHPALVLWAGDNECDQSYYWGGEHRDPNTNILTRKILPEVLNVYDFSRPYLPSSPFVDEEAFRTGKPISEDHLWGPRDYFKGDYYKNTVCHFASETGYHGCPSVESLKKYIAEDHLWPCLNDPQWLVHAASMEPGLNAPFAYRIRLMWNQVETLFGKGNRTTENLEDFSLASQISQAEAKKYFIERFRLSKWRRTGIIWWNLIDGWPQISDAIVDYYLDKKLAYSYIKRSQKPLCLMFDEPQNGRLNLCAVNDTRGTKTFSYTVEDDGGNVILSGTASVNSDESAVIASLPASDEKRYYLIRWNDGGEEGLNHYFAGIRDIDYSYYLTLLDKLGRD